MSHIVTIKTEVRDAEAIKAACRRNDLGIPIFGAHKLYQRSSTGWGVFLRDWRYPVVFDVNTGTAEFDNYGGRWGDQGRLDSFLQSYAVEKAKIEARKNGHSCVEQAQADGSIKLVIGGVE